MSTYVLIHGAWHGRWCWDKVMPLLAKAGHTVVAPDLPGHRNDSTPIGEISLRSYCERVCQVLDAQTEPVILVGHSMGGIVITQAAEYRPDKIKKLVYLTAFLLQNSEFLLQYAGQDETSAVTANLIVAEDHSCASVRADALREAFYGDCSDEDSMRATSLLVPQSVAPLVTPVSTSSQNFGRIPRVYISCLRDRAITPAIQKLMYENIPCERFIQMDSSHSPFFSAPEELAGHLLSL